jgi:hypothetical protein
MGRKQGPGPLGQTAAFDEADPRNVKKMPLITFSYL